VKITIQANTSEISQEEIKSQLTKNQLNSIKGKSLVAYTIAEEGESHPVVVGEGSQRLTWPRAVIRRIKDAVKSGTKLFNRHNSDNSTTGRKPVGEVITTFTKDFGGKLRTIAVACMEKADAALFDICSIEADVLENNGIVGDVDQVTGIAVSNSRIDTPAFRNAKRMQTVQCFNSSEELNNLEKDKNMPITLEDLITAPIALIKQAIGAREMHPSQLFDLAAYERDNEIGPILKERANLKTKVTDLEKDVETQKGLVTEASKKTAAITGKELLKERMPEGFTEKQKSFIEKKFDPESFDLIDNASIDKFIDSGKKDFQEFAELFEGKTDNSGSTDDQTTITKEGDTSIEDAFTEE